MRIVDKNLVILHEKEQKQKEDNQRKTKKTNKKISLLVSIQIIQQPT